MPAFCNAKLAAESLVHSNPLSEANQNPTLGQSLMKRWCDRLVHLGFTHLRWLATCGVFGLDGMEFKSTNVIPPKCEPCLLGRQEQVPIKGNKHAQENKGILKAGKLNPGDLVFSDQCVLSLEGQNFNNRGQTLRHQSFKGGAVFCDAASSFLFIAHQQGFANHEATQSKSSFEQEAAQAGATVKEFCTNNGVFAAKGLRMLLDEQDQKICRSGIGGHHCNGVAKNAIKNLTRCARIMMFQAALHWPNESGRTLWPPAMQHAVHLHNSTPRDGRRTDPRKSLAWITESHGSIAQFPHMGQPSLRSFSRLARFPRREPMPHQGQCAGFFPLHASTLSLARSLCTHRLSLQFRCVHDGHFEMINCPENVPPDDWDEFCLQNKFRSDLDDGNFIPELDKEWLLPGEFNQKRACGQIANLRKEESQQGNLPEQIRAWEEVPDVVQRADAGGVGQSPHSWASEPEQTELRPTSVQEDAPLSNHGLGMASGGQLGDESVPEGAKAPESFQPRRSGHMHCEPLHFKFDKQHGCLAVKGHLKSMAKGMGLRCGQCFKGELPMNLLWDPEFALCDAFNFSDPTLLTRNQSAWKTKAQSDPDLPSFKEALRGPRCKQFLEAMQKEIEELGGHKTWRVVQKTDLKPDANGERPNIIPATWAFRIK